MKEKSGYAIFATKLQNFHPNFAARIKNKKRWHTHIIMNIANMAAHTTTNIITSMGMDTITVTTTSTTKA